jgi:lysophospholipid acyltransferase (LPLAT)-like uncharacterized protein
VKTAHAIAFHGIHLLSKTWRISAHNIPKHQQCIIAFWHDEMLPIWKFLASIAPNNSALISKSKDGEILARLLERWGYTVVRGSSSQGGKEALQSLVSLAEHNRVLLTPDGPRGPRHSMKAGAVVAAMRANVPLYLCRASYNGIRLEKSWDKFHVPTPFCRIQLCFSEPYYIASTITRDEVTERIGQYEKEMQHLA